MSIKDKVKLNLMVFILTIAGVIHLVSPEVFLPAMPDYIPFHLTLIYVTGVLEILFAIGILLKKYRYRTSKLLTLYFIAILPAHFHIAINGIPMFGIDDPILLWGRT